MSLGTDPEFFLYDTKLNKYVPAHSVGIPPQDARIKVYSGGAPLGSYFRDGYAVEINVPVTTCRETLAFYVYGVIRAVRERLGDRYNLVTTPAIEIDLKEDLKDAPADVLMFGCRPSICAYSLEPKIPPIDALSHPYRYAGGHMHISSGAPLMRNPETAALLVRMLDYYVGIPLTYLFNTDASRARRKWYGQAGEFRMQTYAHDVHGIEYRAPGPELINNQALISWAFGVMRKVARDFVYYAAVWKKNLEEPVRHAINTGDGVEKLFESLLGEPFYERGTWEYIHSNGVFNKMTVPDKLGSYSLGWDYLVHGGRIN